MNNVIYLQTHRKARAKGVTLCQTGFHKWKVVPEQLLDVRQGKLLYTERRQRCNEERTRLA